MKKQKPADVDPSSKVTPEERQIDVECTAVALTWVKGACCHPRSYGRAPVKLGLVEQLVDLIHLGYVGRACDAAIPFGRHKGFPLLWIRHP